MSHKGQVKSRRPGLGQSSWCLTWSPERSSPVLVRSRGLHSQDKWFYVRNSALTGKNLGLTQSLCLRADTQMIHKGPRVECDAEIERGVVCLLGPGNGVFSIFKKGPTP